MCLRPFTRSRLLSAVTPRSFQHWPKLRPAHRTPRLPASRVMSTLPEPTNEHLLIDAEGREVQNLSFESEALGMPAADGYGWVQFEFGDTIGEDQRYTIIRKLGWGMHSSTWLARDKILNKYVAVKVLTGHMTQMYDSSVVWEVDALRLLSSLPLSEHCVQLLDDFTIQGRGSAGSHLCFVMPLYGGDVKALVNSRDTPLPLPLSKRIILHLLRGISHAHGRGVVHTDIKHDNIFFETQASAADIEKWTAEDPPRRHPPEKSHDGIVQAAVSQPMKLPSEEEALRTNFLLGDFGCAQPSNLSLHDTRVITTVPLRAPEVYLAGKWDKPADIWSFGCLIYELVISRPLFCYKVNQKFNLSEDENMLYQMMVFTGEVFRAKQLRVCPLAGEFFKEDCQLKKEPTVIEWPLEHLIGQHKLVPDDELPAMANFMRRCLRLNPDDRATAEELLTDPWLQGL